MSIMMEILSGRYMAKKLSADLESICLNAEDVKELGSELLQKAPSLIETSAAVQMSIEGIIQGPLRIFGMNVISAKEAIK